MLISAIPSDDIGVMTGVNTDTCKLTKVICQRPPDDVVLLILVSKQIYVIIVLILVSKQIYVIIVLILVSKQIYVIIVILNLISSVIVQGRK